MKLEQYLDVKQLHEHVANGLVTAVKHPHLPLLIFTYSRKAVYENIWDDITVKCRGLIVDNTGVIVARPFEKFFNILTMTREETWLSNLPAENPEVTEKLDGSLGILYRFEGYTGIASKGSFASEHAIWATEHYQAKHKDATWPEGWTPVFEMIAESVQTHVVHYGTEDELVLTALINNDTGEEAAYEDLYYWAMSNKFSVVEVFDKTVGTVLNEDRKNKEGYVLTWRRPGQTPLKVKVKHETFLALQKISHAATPKNILQAFLEGREKQVEEWSAESNGEVGAYVRRWATEFRAQFGAAVTMTAHIVRNAEARYTTRKDFADFFNKPGHQEYAPAAFAMIDRKPKDIVAKIIWRIVQKLTANVTEQPVYAIDEDDGDQE